MSDANETTTPPEPPELWWTSSAVLWRDRTTGKIFDTFPDEEYPALPADAVRLVPQPTPQPEDVWRIAVDVPASLDRDRRRELLTAVARVVEDWESQVRESWYVDVDTHVSGFSRSHSVEVHAHRLSVEVSGLRAENERLRTEIEGFRSTTQHVGHERRQMADEFEKHLAKARRELEDARETPKRVLRILKDLVDPDPCCFDHNGGCQAHGYLSLEPGEVCPHQEAKDLLSALPAVDGGAEDEPTPLEDLQYAVSDWLDKPHRSERWEALCALLPEDWASHGNPLWQGWPKERDPARPAPSGSGGFYEDDEPIEDVAAAVESGVPVVTEAPVEEPGETPLSEIVTAHKLDRIGSVVVGTLLPYDPEIGERVRDLNGVVWPVRADSVRPSPQNSEASE